MHNIGFVVFPDFQVIGLSLITVFEVANTVAPSPFYKVKLLSEHGGLVRSSAGFSVETAPFGRAKFDTVIIGAGMEPGPATPGLLGFVRRSMRSARRVAAPCVGAFTLAEAGALDGRRATTHWAFARDLQARFPLVKVDEDRIFIADQPVWTSAGMSAGVDLALALVEEDLGADAARSVARKMVLYHRRAGGQSQFSSLLELAPKTDRIQKALAFARQNLRSTLNVDRLAEAASLSTRQFTRAFREETGHSPAKAVERLRVESARLLMEQGRLPMDVIASETGFADRERMRRAFLRAFNQAPQAMRRSFRTADEVQRQSSLLR